MTRNLRIIIRPSIETTYKSLGLKENDEFQSINIHIEQDYRSKVREIFENELFIIPEGYSGIIDSDKEDYLLSDRKYLEFKNNDRIKDELIPGIYKLSAKEFVIFRFADEDNNRFDIKEEEFYFELNSVSEEDIIHYKEIFNFIKNYAKTKFDFKSLANETDEETAELLLYLLIRAFSTQELNKVIVDNLSEILLERGYNIEKKVLVKLVRKSSNDLIIAALNYGSVIDEIEKGTKKISLLNLQKSFYE
jgi:hypothetical protein